MATMQDVLNQLYNQQSIIQEKETDVDNDHIECTVDVDARTLSLNTSVIGVETDKSVERIYFKAGRYSGDYIDLSKYLFKIHYVNAIGETGTYIVEDVVVGENDLKWTWRLSPSVTAHAGDVTFSVEAVRMLGDQVLREWNTTVCEAEILESIEHDDDDIEIIDTDNITEYLREVDEKVTASDLKAEEAKATANEAKTIANEAKCLADEAQDTADDAKLLAQAAQRTADTAQTTAETAQRTAETAQRLTEQIHDEVIDAKDRAEEAQDLATEALNLARGMSGSTDLTEIRNLANSAISGLDGKIDKDQGADNSGKMFLVSDSGEVELIDPSEVMSLEVDETTIEEATDIIINSIRNGELELPTADTEVKGVVKSSLETNKIKVDDDGFMELNDISVEKLVENDGIDLILNCGNA